MNTLVHSTIETIELKKDRRIVILNTLQNQVTQKTDLDFNKILESIKCQFQLLFTDKILYFSPNGVYYIISLTSAIFLDDVECLNTNQQSKALKLLKKRVK